MCLPSLPLALFDHILLSSSFTLACSLPQRLTWSLFHSLVATTLLSDGCSEEPPRAVFLAAQEAP